MRPEQHYHDDVTWWQRTGVNPWGDASFATPVPIKGHWQDKDEIFTGADGEQLVAASVVHVDRDLAVGDYILDGISTWVDPLGAGASRIEGWRRSKIPGETVYVRRAYLTA